MTRNLSMESRAKQSAEKELFGLLQKTDPVKFKAYKIIKTALLTAGVMFGVIVFLIFYMEPEPDIPFAIGIGVGVSIIGVSMEYLVWRVMVKFYLAGIKKEMAEN